jgi:hypothetical protein
LDYDAGLPRKNVVVAVLLAIFLGPIGMFYSTITGALTMLSVVFLSAAGAYVYLMRLVGAPSDLNWGFVFSPYGLLAYEFAVGIIGILLYAICIFWALFAAQRHNLMLLASEDELDAGSTEWNLPPGRIASRPSSTTTSSDVELECPHCGKATKLVDVRKFCNECGGQMPVVRKADAAQ